MSVTNRDKKVLAVVLALVAVVGYWFVVLGPKRDEAAKAGEALSAQEKQRDEAVARERSLQQARTQYATDYAAVVRLGKAIPSSVDMPSLIVQLDEASEGSGIDFQSVKAGPRAPAATAPAPPPGDPAKPGGKPDAPVAPGGEPAQSAPGGAGETAGNKVEQANAQSEAASKQSGLDPADTQTSEKARDGALPVGGGAGGGAPTAPQGAGAPGLDSVPLEFAFDGDFFELADFLHRLKRFVYIANDGIEVSGRLMTIDSFKFSSATTGSEAKRGGGLSADVKATVYLSPKQQGTTAGATPQGPAPAAPQEAGAPAPQGGSPAAPTATVSP